jgi:hypothetical protein
MLQNLFKIMFRTTEHKAVRRADAQRCPPAGEARSGKRGPTPAFLAHILRSALAQARGGRFMHQPLNESAPKPESHEEEEADGKVVRLMPRRRPATERIPDPSTHDDDDDPGPSAA